MMLKIFGKREYLELNYPHLDRSAPINYAYQLATVFFSKTLSYIYLYELLFINPKGILYNKVLLVDMRTQYC